MYFGVKAPDIVDWLWVEKEREGIKDGIKFWGLGYLVDGAVVSDMEY